MSSSVSRAMAKIAPNWMKEALRGSLYWAIPYTISQLVDRLVRPKTYRLLRDFEPHCRRYGCIFVHVPRTAGTSFHKALFDGPKPGGHQPAWHYRMVFDRQEFEELYKFSIVRNPWDRLVSTFFFLKNGGMREEDRLWAEEHLSAYDSFDEFVRGWLRPGRLDAYTHFRPQSYYLVNPRGKLEVDYVGRFEELQRAFGEVKAALGLAGSLPHRNEAPRRRDYREYYSDRAAEIVRDVYARDIEMLGYEF